MADPLVASEMKLQGKPHNLHSQIFEFAHSDPHRFSDDPANEILDQPLGSVF